jgi:very-short-patch-repair endonuclease
MAKHYPRQDPRLRGKLRTAARQMRQEPTPAEAWLWQRLHSRQLAGQKFHRQYPIDRFIVDFFCSSAALIIEVDGEVHQQQGEADQEREQFLTGLGFRLLRFPNAQVLDQIEQVLQVILEALAGDPLSIPNTFASTGTPSPLSPDLGESGEGAGG